MLTDAELTKLIDGGESDRVEFKESASDLGPHCKAICAFANDMSNNKQPGVLFVGLRDNGDCADLPIDTKLLEKLASLRGNGNIQPFPVIEVARKNLSGCPIAVVQVEASVNPPIRFNGRCWIRVGPTQRQASAEEERRLTEKRQWGDLPYDMREVRGASVENDLDMRRFETEYLPSAISPEMLEENQRLPEEQLQALRLTARDGTPTVTAILVLGKDPAQWFPCAYIQFIRYDGNEVTDPIVDEREIRGTLWDQLDKLAEVLKVHIRTALDMKGAVHEEKPDYPERALRELAYNAVIHRNYEGSSTPLYIRWFTDNIEITSPGSVHGELDPEKFGEPWITAYRNPTLAEAMKNLGFMERFGTGIFTARKALCDNGNPQPVFRVEGNFTFVKIRKRA